MSEVCKFFCVCVASGWVGEWNGGGKQKDSRSRISIRKPHFFVGSLEQLFDHDQNQLGTYILTSSTTKGRMSSVVLLLAVGLLEESEKNYSCVPAPCPLQFRCPPAQARSRRTHPKSAKRYIPVVRADIYTVVDRWCFHLFWSIRIEVVNFRFFSPAICETCQRCNNLSVSRGTEVDGSHRDRWIHHVYHEGLFTYVVKVDLSM